MLESEVNLLRLQNNLYKQFEINKTNVLQIMNSSHLSVQLLFYLKFMYVLYIQDISFQFSHTVKKTSDAIQQRKKFHVKNVSVEKRIQISIALWNSFIKKNLILTFFRDSHFYNTRHRVCNQIIMITYKIYTLFFTLTLLEIFTRIF